MSVSGEQELSKPGEEPSVEEAKAERPVDPAVERIHRLFAWPVFISALLTVVGLMLGLAEQYADLGEMLVNTGALVVGAEFAAALIASGDKRRWFKDHLALIVIGVASIGVFVGGHGIPVHLVRLVPRVGSSHFLTVMKKAKVTKVGELNRTRTHVDETPGLALRWRRVLDAVLIALVPIYVGLALRDRSSASRELLREVRDDVPGYPGRTALFVVVLVAVIVFSRIHASREAARDASGTEPAGSPA